MNHTTEAIQGNMDIDPLSSYEYPSYDTYPTVAPLNPMSYPYSIKVEQSMYQAYQHNNTNYINNGQNSMQEEIVNPLPTLQTTVEKTNNDDQDLKPVLTRRKKEKNGQKSTYCSKKITDATFPFYGCSICNISYTALPELDQHVTAHKNRMTSYRLRLRNQFKKKQIKKEKKKLKKMVKIKKENDDFEIEIKPEEGYIGNEKATDFNNGINSNSECNGNQDNVNSATVPQYSQIITNNGSNSISNDTMSNDNDSMNNGNVNNENNETDSGNNINNSKENSMDEIELNNLEKIYKCFACQKQFTLSYYLKLHVRSHTDEKPYTCSVCGQSFITASKLGRHNKRIHLAERFQCRICFKIFSRFELLTVHFDKTHPEDKLEGEPYDYNAILPYLKELEEQLRITTEEKDKKPKAEDLLWEQQVGPAPGDTGPSAGPGGVKEEVKDEDEKDIDIVPKIDIVIEELAFDVDVKVKQELSDDDTPSAHGGGEHADEHEGGELGHEGGEHGHEGGEHGEGRAGDENDGVKDEHSDSDSDYFPSNTWAAPPPRTEAAPPSPRRRKKSSKICEICNKRISSASYMRVHMRTHTGEKPFKCYKCGRGFITSSKMHRHVLTHEQDKDNVKLEDGAPSEAEEEAGDDEHADDTKKPAKKKSKMKSKLSTKIKNGDDKPTRKPQKRRHACEYCNQKFLHLNMLEVHKKCHEGEALVHKCHYCLEEALDEAALKEHEATHTGAKPYLCTICGKGYKKRETMVYHRKRHLPDREFVCDICSKRFNAACKLHKHMLTHRADRFVLRYECPVCAHMFNTKYHVHMHLNTHQKEGLILEENRNEILAMVLQNARKIPKQADAPTNLTDIIPSDERSRICNICGEIFHHFYYLEEHLKSHGSRIAVDDIDKEEEKKYICQICNKGFKLHYYLKLHSFTHSKEKPFICQQCGKGFITKGKLKRHLETHTGLKKYQCHICYKFFTRPSYLRIHIRTIHGTQDYNFRFDKGYGVNSLAMSAIAMSDVSQNSM